jgi:Tfp pilus assembly PilM family ATPase/Tfp pilus assembly protein PilN
MVKVNIKKFNPFSGANKNECVAVDFSGNNLKLAHLRVWPNKREVVNLMSRDISNLSDADISKAVKLSYDELRAVNPAIINIIPSNLVITKNIEIPSSSEKEIREIINLQASRHTPYSREEIVVDYLDVGVYRHTYTKILLVIVARSVIKRHSEILEAAGLKLDKVLLAAEGLACNAVRVLKAENSNNPVSIVHIDEFFTDFSVVYKNKAIFIRPIPIGTQQLILDKEKYELKFVEELKRSLEAYQGEDIERSPNLLVFTGATEEIPSLESVLASNLHIPIRAVPYFKNLAISVEALKTITISKRTSFLNIIAPLLNCDEAKINLVPEEVKLRKALQERGKSLIKTGILILTSLLLVFVILASKIYFKIAHINSLNKRFSAINQEARKLEADFSKIGMVKEYLSNRMFALDVLTELYMIVPNDLWINDIRFDQNGKFIVKGTAESMSTVFAFIDNMEKSRYFKDVKTQYTAKRKDGMADFTDFEINSSLDKES